MAVLAERVRVDKEVARLAREQEEVIRRREADEIFRHVTKVNQDCAELYLEDIVREAVESIAESNAREYIEQLADKIDAMEEYARET